MESLKIDDSNTDNEVFTKQNGKKDQAVTKPIAIDSTTGEVVVRKSTGKAKIRKGQSEEEYQNQLDHYFNVEKGPTITEDNWMDSIDPLDMLNDNIENDLSIKNVRHKLTSFCERYYYYKRYQECYNLAIKLREKYQAINKKNKMDREIEGLDYLIDKCILKGDIS
ncbi:hypothetical protein TPHA_0I01640 [Tetrapisispora phaffii CBS 4417]|uniref:Uncharacterized protein n=1 Tax=Tetrapisispora phaffii (strain ATCC 24235 / CBS 4417 / NBRC 1672 / NRRL Y-8282 / UCD 70-5) TaxID=1071381 RepID=G8BXP0_TETPH|nr:hypothetical protein TPHA_0I01640 [Tetrapisispora phaffii CBS 4417]CCE64668.1 hypothetical protein TPHA_0I01640 [Tetrapisispora phaffii CBS 4417]